MLGNAHATFKFITPIFIIIVTMQRRDAKERRNRNGYTMHVMRIICACDIQTQQKAKESLPMNLPDEFDMRTREQSRSASVTSPEPIVVDILRFSDMRTTRENKLVFNFFFWVPRPPSVDDEADTTVRREPAEGWDNRSRGGTGRG